MTHTDRQQAEQQMDDSDKPMKIADHERRLGQAEDNHQAANNGRKYGNHPAAGREKRLCDTNDPQSANGEQSKQHMKREQVHRATGPEEKPKYQGQESSEAQNH